MEEKLNILVCEDEALVARDLKNRIRDCGHTVTALARSGKDAIQATRRQRPDLALMDIRLAGEMNGIETAHILNDQFNVPSIYVSADSDAMTLEEAKKTEPLGFLCKPIDEQTLRSTIELGMYRFRRQETLQDSLRKLRALRFTDGSMNHTIELVINLLHQESPRTSQPVEKKCKKQECIIEEVVNRGIALTQNSIAPNIHLITSFSPESLRASVDPDLVALALRNIVENGAQTIGKEDGIIHICTGLRYEEAPQQFNPAASPGWYIAVQVKDSGIGAPREAQQQVYQPFLSGCHVDHATAMGLAEVYSITQVHGGWMKVDTQLNVGRTVTLYLPSFNASEEENGSERDFDPRKLQTKGTLLLVDDEPAILDMLGKYFRLNGYQSYAFTRSSDALRWYAHHRKRVDLVILDLNMPELDGESCFNQIKNMNTEQSIALMSGIPQQPVVQSLLSKGAKKFFAKPFDMQSILDWVEDHRATIAH